MELGTLALCILLIYIFIKKANKIQEREDSSIKIAENLEKLANTQNTNAELLARIEKLEKALQEQKK